MTSDSAKIEPRKTSWWGESKSSPLSMAITIIVSSFVAGMEAGIGVHDLVRARFEYSWVGDFCMTFAFLFLGIVWTVRLLAKIRKNPEFAQN